MASTPSRVAETVAQENENDKENVKQPETESAPSAKTETAETSAQKDGKRVQQLQAAMNKALEKTLRSCTYSQISQYFNDTTDEQDRLLQSAFERIQDFLHESMHDELNLILDETNLRTKLNELDTLIETAPADSPAAALPRDNIDPSSLIRAHVLPVKQAYKEQLQAQLQQAAEQNEQRKQQVLDQRHELRALFGEIEDLARQITVAAELCETVPRAQLQATAMELDNM